MGFTISIFAIAVSAALIAALTGRWRIVLAPFRIRANRMTVDRLGLLVSSTADAERVDTILRSFAGGFNAMLTSPSVSAVENYCDALPSFYQPFAHEGVAMGYTPRNLFLYTPSAFETRIVKRRPELRYLYYVGLGFWSGMRNHRPGKLERIVDGLDPLHGYLCYDGYGFKHAFFDYPKNPSVLGKLEHLSGYRRNAAYQGVGRAFFFRFMDDPHTLIEHLSRLGAYAADGAAGVGLASVFVNPDRLEKAQALAAEMPSEWQAHFHLGMCFALKARSINNPDRFERDMARVPDAVAKAAWAAIRECDRVELQIRSQEGEDRYRRWRERVADWMAEHIEYPLAGVKASATNEVTSAVAPA
ncbi:MAG: DUF1702 family protein [Planctomycetes bacterium]|nr:DUF1702 family protein [Planctomycetota bacterium]